MLYYPRKGRKTIVFRRFRTYGQEEGITVEFLQLKYFKTVAEKGKIVAAAESLFISPPALSATISRLEKELNVKLFDRTNNSITLNQQGEIFLRYTNQVLSSLENAKLELQQSMQNKDPHIRIATTTSNLWIGLLCAFSLECPQITLSNTTLKLSQIPAASLSPQYNFLLAEEQDLHSDKLDSLTLIENDRPVLMVHPAHPLASRRSIDLRSITDETFFLPVADMSMYKMVKELLTLANAPMHNTYEYSYMLRRQMVAENRGVSFSTVYTCQAEDPNLRYIPIEIPFYQQKQMIFWDKDRELSHEEETFRAFAVDYFRSGQSVKNT